MHDKYVLDSTAMKYMLEGFPRRLMGEIWKIFLLNCNNENIVSSRETKKILEYELVEEESLEWIENQKSIFKAINQKESLKLGELINEHIFDYYDKTNEFARKLPFSIPFLITIAIIQKRTIVLCKTCKDRKKIIDICKQNDIEYVFAEDFLIRIKHEATL